MTDKTRRDGGAFEIDRRSVLRAAGAAAIGTGAATGVASAGNGTDGPVFCGCSQVCACVECDAWVIVAEKTNGEYVCRRVKQEYNFCYSVGDDEKIIALDVKDDGLYRNPNTACAGTALQDCGYTGGTTGERGGPCGHPPCEHPGRGNGRGNGRGHGNGPN